MSLIRHYSVFALLTLCVIAGPVSATEPGDDPTLADDIAPINRFIRLRWDAESIEPAKRCTDREFVRRVYLDLAGRVPTTEEVDAFLADERKTRREALVDELLDSEDYVQHFADLFDTLLMGRTDEGKYNQRVSSGWRSYLEQLFRENRPWNKVAAEILLARPQEKDKRGAVWFLYERNDKHQAIAEAVAPAFFGIRIECAQCHDHMSAYEIEQAHYWGLVAFFNRGKNTKGKQGIQVAESAIGGFSEFANLEGDSTPNRLTFFGVQEVVEPRPDADTKQKDSDDLYTQASDEGTPRVPKFSRRERFVSEVLHDHPLLARAMVNRLWAIMLGRGIVHPFDEMDSVHPPSHPELLDHLAQEFVTSDYNIRTIVRRLALCDAYQLQSRRPEGVSDPATFAWYLERPLTGEQLARSIQLIARGSFKNDAEIVKQFRQQITDVLPDETVVGIDDTLFFSNGSGLEQFLNEDTDNTGLLHRVSQYPSAERRVDELFGAVYGREPEADESRAVAEYLNQRKTQQDNALRQVLWSLLMNAEFQFNH